MSMLKIEEEKCLANEGLRLSEFNQDECCRVRAGVG
jgi:hypothetical protein